MDLLKWRWMMNDYRKMWTDATITVLDLKQTIRTQKDLIDRAEIDAENFKIGRNLQNKMINNLDTLNDELRKDKDRLTAELEVIRLHAKKQH